MTNHARLVSPGIQVASADSFACGGVRIDALQLDDGAERLLDRANPLRAVHLCNAYTLSLARRDPVYRDRLNNDDLNLPDGMPLIWLGRWRGMSHLRERVYGPDLMQMAIDRGRGSGTRHYLYGSTPDVLRALVTALEDRFPGANVVGVESPPFRDLTPDEEDAVVERIGTSEADIVWVGLGTPRQDVFVNHFRGRVPATLVAVGAAFDFHAGTKAQAPRWMQQCGLEWLFRLVKEPRRLWRRYLLGNVGFLVGVVRDTRPRRDAPGGDMTRADTRRVLVVHNRYRSAQPSGENTVVDDEIAMLRSAGVEVAGYLRDSDEIESFGPVGRASLMARPVASPVDMVAFGRLVTSFRPDVVHLHNPYPLISPGVVRVARAKRVPVVQTVHNYRHMCLNGLFYRDGHVCEDCAGRAVPWPGVVHGCYRGSHAQSVPLAAALAAHRRTWQLVDRFLPVSGFVADKLVDAGIARSRVTVKYNAVIDQGRPAPMGSGLLFAGRLEHEKGILMLLDAWERSGLGSRTSLTIVGDGPERAAVERAAALTRRGVRYLGAVAPTEVMTQLDRSQALVLPSLCYEGFPLAAVEAFSRGRPVIASRNGSLADIVTSDVGWTAEPNAADFATVLCDAMDDPAAIGRRGATARDRYERRFTPGAVTAALVEVYDRVAGPASASEVPVAVGHRRPRMLRAKPRRVFVEATVEALR